MTAALMTESGTGRSDYPACLLGRLHNSWGLGQRNSWLLTLGGEADELALTWAAKGVRVTALDPSETALKRLAELAEKTNVELTLHQAPAEATGLQPARYDAVVAVQSWPLFDRQKAIQEARRLLVNRGALVLAQLTPLSQAGNLVEATHRLMEMHVSFWLRSSGEGFFPEWIEGLSHEGFSEVESFTYDLALPISPQVWRDTCRRTLAGQLDSDRLEKFDEDLAALLEQHFVQHKRSSGQGNETGISVPHRVFALRALKA